MKKLKPHPHVIKLIACVTESGTEKNIFMSHGYLNLTIRNLVEENDMHLVIILH